MGKVSTTTVTKITITHGTTKKELAEAMAEVADDAKVSVQKYLADRPGEISVDEIIFTKTGASQ